VRAVAAAIGGDVEIEALDGHGTSAAIVVPASMNGA
jgi:hypothetical protein